jgi:hypothetical protein
MASTNVAPRPISIDGCFQTWAETDKSQIIRSEMDFGTVKVRRRTTGIIWTIEAGVTLKAEQYEDFQTWFRVNCQAGVIPTRIKRPMDAKEVVARFTEPPQIQWLDMEKNAFHAACKFEQLPEWGNL